MRHKFRKRAQLLLAVLGSTACGGSSQSSLERPNLPTPWAIRCEDYVACELACAEQRKEGCADLARMFESGRGAPQNLARAAELYEQACRMQSREACAHLALLYDVGLGVEHDLSHAAYWYETACALGDGWSCARKRRLQKKAP